jgi:hypothetical protein
LASSWTITPEVKNDTDCFGEQVTYNEVGGCLEREDHLMLCSCQTFFDQAVSLITHGGDLALSTMATGKPMMTIDFLLCRHSSRNFVAVTPALKDTDSAFGQDMLTNNMQMYDI